MTIDAQFTNYSGTSGNLSAFINYPFQILSPSGGTEFEKGDIVTISVDAEDPDGRITTVRFYIDDDYAGTSITAII